MWANQVGNFFRARSECRQEKTGVPELVFIRRIVQDLDRFRVGGFLFVNRSRKSEMAEGFLVLNEQLIEEGQAGIEAMAKNGVAKLVRYDGGQARFIRKHVDEAAAQHDGMAYRVRFQRCGGYHSATDVGFDVDVVGDLEVVDHRLEHLVDFSLRRDQSNSL